MTGLKKTSIYQKMKEGDFPLGFYISTHSRRWPEGEVIAWIQAQKLAPTAQRAVLAEKNAARLNAARLGHQAQASAAKRGAEVAVDVQRDVGQGRGAVS